eukprot:gene13846-19768_t
MERIKSLSTTPPVLLCRGSSLETAMPTSLYNPPTNSAGSQTGPTGFKNTSAAAKNTPEGVKEDIHFQLHRVDSGDWGGERTTVNPIQNSSLYYQSKTFADSSKMKFEFS